MSGPGQSAAAVLAGEYVLGLLDAAQAAEVAARAASDPVLAAEIRLWRARLAPLDEDVEEAAPSPALWRRIETSLEALGAPAPARPARRAPPWRGLALGSMAVAASLALALCLPLWRAELGAPHAPWARAVALLTVPGTPRAALRAQVVTGGTITLVPLRPLAASPGHHLGFWAWPRDHAAPVLLGTLPPAGGALRYPFALLDNTPVMVTEEPDAPAAPQAAPGRTLYLGILAGTG